MTMTVAGSGLPICEEYSACAFRNFLSECQQETYRKHTDSVLRNHIGNVLLATDDRQDLETARLILDIVALYPEAGKNCGVIFFMNLVDSPSGECNKYLRMLQDIVKNDLGEIFFKCASTHKNEYYDEQVLFEILTAFHKIIPHLPNPCPAFSHFLPYDQGGKEVLAELVKNPNNLDSLVKAPAASAPSQLQAAAPPNLEDLITKSEDFNQMKEGAIRYLASLSDKNRLKMEVYLKLFKELQDDSKMKKYNFDEKRGIITLILLTTVDEQAPVSTKYTLADLHELITEAQLINKVCGEEVLAEICNAFKVHKVIFLDDVIRTLKHLNHCYPDLSKQDRIQRVMSDFSAGNLNLSGLLKTLEALNPEFLAVEVFDKESLDSLYQRFVGKANDPNVVYPLPEAIVAKIKTQYMYVQEYCKEWKQLRIGELVNKASVISLKGQNTSFTEDDILQLVAIGRLAIQIKYKMYLYNTQVCTVLAEMMFPDGAIAQVKTGEGKSMIVALLAFVLTLQHKAQGHIISSSRSLCIRDQRSYEDFFLTFGVTTSHICEDARDASHYQGQILYGTATDFEFAIMREMQYHSTFYPKTLVDVKGKRFCWVIVDEMDNLTIDTARSGARLASPPEITYDWVYFPILQFVQANTSFDSGSSLDPLKDYLKKYMDGRFARSVNNISDKKLRIWLKSAKEALFDRHEKDHYVIDLRETRNGDKVNGIIIVDADNTGQFMANSRWQNGLHEFLEAKNNLDIEQESISSISMTHPVFYDMYKHVYGITGTIGSNFEREELKAIYNLTSFDVPTHNLPKRRDLPTIILETTKEYLNEIARVTKECIHNHRPILILCATIKDTEMMVECLNSIKDVFQILIGNEKNEEHVAKVIEKAGLPGAVTIATNIAGRGTDIKPLLESLVNGGLHVLITFYPDSDRVEMQARGRAGRQGQEGSSQIILSKGILSHKDSTFLQKDQAEILEYLNRQRQQKAIIQKDTHLSYALIERYCFRKVVIFYEQLNALQELSLQDSFLNKLAEYLSNLKSVSPYKIDFEGISPKNRLIAQEALKLLATFSDCTKHWKTLVSQLADRVRHAMINDFSLNFYAAVDETIQDSGIISNSEKLTQFKMWLKSICNVPKNEIESVFQSMEKVVKEDSEKALEAVQNDIKDLYEKRESFWGKYLDPSGRGLIHYLSELIKIDLNPGEINTLIERPLKTVQNGTDAVVFHVDFQTDESAHTKKMNTKVRTSPFATTEADKDISKLAVESLGAKSNRNSFVEMDEKSFGDSYSRFNTETPSYRFEHCDVELPTFQAGTPLPLPPQGGIQIGLRNFGNTCWFNSILKFIACTSFYDQMLTDTPPIGKERLQGLLRELVISLRSGKEPGNYLNAFLKEINTSIPTLRIGQQQDAPELLLNFINQLKWKPAHTTRGLEIEAFHNQNIYPRLGIMYTPLEVMPAGWQQYGTVNNFQTHIDITIPEEFTGKELDLSILLNEEGVRELKPEKIQATAQENVGKMNFASKTYLLNLPQIIMIYVKRVSNKTTGSSHSQRRIASPLKMDANNLISLTKCRANYQTINQSQKVVGMQSEELGLYRIGAAVVHTGDVDQGHYQCMEKARNGTLIKHNDSICEVNPNKDLSNLGYFVRLDRVR